MENIKEINDQNFDEEVLKCELPVLVCFTTKWCRTCYPTCLVADELFGEYNGKVKFVKIDIEESPKIAEKHHVISVPTILIFKESQVVKKLISFQDRTSLKSTLNSVTAK